MIKCLECGFEADRLQWTHFKYNCSGRFANGREYQQAYPGAKLVSDSLAKRTSVTLENLQTKYGIEEGLRRWESYKAKQAYTNSFEHKQEKYGWSQQEFDAYNASRAQTLTKMIERHGEELGSKKWIEYCQRQAYTNTKNYFIEKYGEVAGNKKYAEVNDSKRVNDPQVIAAKFGISYDEAVEVLLTRYKSSFASEMELEFIDGLEGLLGPLNHSSKRRPFGKWSTLLDTYVIYDIEHNGCIIEFNGDYWHANPNTYTSSALIRGKSAFDIWQRDMLKCQTAIDLGFKVKTVWESDYRKDKQQTIKEVYEWILQEQQLPK